MIFPRIFANRFPSRRSIITPNERVSIWQVADALARTYIVKTTPIERRPAPEVLEVLKGLQGINVVAPIECHTDGEWCHQLLPHFPLGSLDDLLTRASALSSDDCEELLRQVGDILAQLHMLGDGSSIVHRDIKPSNILLGHDGQGRRLYFLADFDAAVVYQHSPRAEEIEGVRRYTLRYAAPEIVGGGTASPSADWWSLGMLLLECLTGRHPLEGRKSDGIRMLLSTDWRPTFDKVDQYQVDQYWRAVFGGLFDRVPSTRWGHQEIRRWLDRDPAVISNGLAKAGEEAAHTPFLVGSTLAYSSKALAEALLGQWEVIR